MMKPMKGALPWRVFLFLDLSMCQNRLAVLALAQEDSPGLSGCNRNLRPPTNKIAQPILLIRKRASGTSSDSANILQIYDKCMTTE